MKKFRARIHHGVGANCGPETNFHDIDATSMTAARKTAKEIANSYVWQGESGQELRGHVADLWQIEEKP